jgi:hypothetical protein
MFSDPTTTRIKATNPVHHILSAESQIGQLKLDNLCVVQIIQRMHLMMSEAAYPKLAVMTTFEKFATGMGIDPLPAHASYIEYLTARMRRHDCCLVRMALRQHFFIPHATQQTREHKHSTIKVIDNLYVRAPAVHIGEWRVRSRVDGTTLISIAIKLLRRARTEDLCKCAIGLNRNRSRPIKLHDTRIYVH